MAAEKPAQPVETAPDPDEDDLDDLDDVLDQFQATKLDTTEPTPAASGPGRPTSSSASAAAPAAPEVDEDEFAKQLQAGMADLLGDLDSDPAMKRQFEELMKGINAAGGDEAATAAAAAASASYSADSTEATTGSTTGPGAEASFQDTIRATMERLQNSGEAAGAAAQSASEDDILAQMLKEMEAGGFGGAEGSEDDFSKMLMGMMEQLTNKDILYEPMKELHDKFPAWVAKNGDKVPEDDMKRYREQQGLVKEIVERFERKGYSDQDAGDREYIVERMQKMQAAGSPPPDLVGDMSAAQQAMGEMDQGCPTQ